MGVSGGEGGLRRAATSILGRQVLQMEDVVPSWYQVDYDTPETRFTLAREYVELLVCAQAERFIGNLAAPSTHAVCSMSGRGSKGAGGGERSRERCIDALGRQIQTGQWSFY